MLDSVLTDNARSGIIRPLDTLLEKYNSEYQYLFARVYDASNCSELKCLELNYVLPNIARRMLEIFLAFRLPDMPSNLRKKLMKVEFDNEKRLRIYDFLNTHSHSNAIGPTEHDPTALAEDKLY